MNRDDLILQSLVADSIQFGNISPSALFPAREQGLTNLKIIAGSFNGTTYSIIALPKFKTLEQLKGAKLAVSSLQAGSTQVLKFILKQKGLIYPRDYNLLRAGGTTPLRRFTNAASGRGCPGGAGEPYCSRERVSQSG